VCLCVCLCVCAAEREARGSLISTMSNPLRRSEDLGGGEDQAGGGRGGALLSEQGDPSDSALDGGMLSIQQTIMKLELAKKHKAKTEESKAEDEKEVSHATTGLPFYEFLKIFSNTYPTDV
jgi:hypothetical protein